MSPAVCGPPVPQKPRKPDRDRLDMRLEPETRQRADRQAERFGLSLSAYIRRALIRQLEEDEASEPKKR